VTKDREYTMTNTYRIADRTVLIHSLYEDVHNLCRDYQTTLPSDEVPDITVSVTQEHIGKERAFSVAEAEREGLPAADYSDSYLETLAVYRQIADRMTAFDTILFHGSAVAVDGVAYLFTAKSGTGKSTHTALWREAFGERAIMVNDDKPLLRVSEEGVTVFGTPWNGKHRLGTNAAFPLRAICILTRDETNHIEPVYKKEVFPALAQQLYRPRNPVGLMQAMCLFDAMLDRVGLYRLGCNMEKEAAEIAYDGMKGSDD